ncbi:MAG: HlyD family efflux transporter periplasmic adaptor subunit, partial [Bryobacteraceae bacterium]|nr:HlyD family efflux transporter periplasmic adaptor subunit [Bryobacteraceae bacterium]
GTLVPEEILWLPALTDGRIEKIRLRPGATVGPDTIIMDLNNPQLELEALNAEWQVKSAEATYKDLAARLQNLKLDQQAAAARVASEYQNSKLNSDVEAKLGEQGLSSEVKVKTTKAIADELHNRAAIEQEKIGSLGQSIEAQLGAQQVQIEKLRAEWGLKKKQVDQLKIRAGVHGVLQQLGANQTAPVEVGQRLAAGTVLAKIAQPSRLKAELKIAETQAKDITIGQIAEIDTRNGVIPGRVSRIDPAAQNGTVTVDVRLEGKLPSGARPDLSVDGTVELERLREVVYVGRPVFGQPNSTITLFRLEADGKEANRIPVRLGRTSVNTIEIVDGLKVGDRVILSDMSAYDSHSRIRLN